MRFSVSVVVLSACSSDESQLESAPSDAAARHGSRGAFDRVWAEEGNQGGATFAFALASAGDVNGDGFDEVVVGAPEYDDGLSNQGKVFVYHGSATGPTMVADWTAAGAQGDDNLGTGVSSAGDVNGDGFDDLIVTAWGALARGAAYVYHGSAVGLDVVAAWTVEPDINGLEYGAGVASAGDVNGDGFDDVLVADPLFSDPPDIVQEGRVHLFLGSATGLDVVPAWEILGDDGFLGMKVASAGDVNGDGFDDVAIADNQWDSERGRVLVFYGSGAGLAATADVVVEGLQSQEHFGDGLGAADVNGDGLHDLLVGASWSSTGFDYHPGRVAAYYGDAAGLATTASWEVLGNEEEAHFGKTVVGGDVTGDGIGDIVVGSGWDPYFGGPDSAFALHIGTAVDPESTPRATRHPGAADHFADTLALGDFNGDGRMDVLAGDPLFDSPAGEEGGAFVYLAQ